MNKSVHAAVRAQQRCIPPLVEQWLDQFGEEKHGGHGEVFQEIPCHLPGAEQ